MNAEAVALRHDFGVRRDRQVRGSRESGHCMAAGEKFADQRAQQRRAAKTTAIALRQPFRIVRDEAGNALRANGTDDADFHLFLRGTIAISIEKNGILQRRRGYGTQY